MNDSSLKMLQDVAAGLLSPEEAQTRLAAENSMREMPSTGNDVPLPVSDLGFATLDHDRERRKGFPEVVFGQGKTVEQLLGIAKRQLEMHDRLLITRISEEAAEAFKAAGIAGRHNPVARCWIVTRDADATPENREKIDESGNTASAIGDVLVVTAGTTDLPVALEALETARALGSRTELLTDVGVAGLHRLMAHRGRLNKAKAIVAVAGMEGALATVIGGLVAVPVIAVPTSVGYGAHLQGVATLLAMLNSCSPGVSVVNIDNGFGAGYSAALINAASFAKG